MPLDTERLASLRDTRKLNNTKISELLDINVNTVGRWVRGETQPSSLNLARLAEVLKTSVDYLVGSTDNPAPAPRRKIELTEWEFNLVEASRTDDYKEIMRLLANRE